MGQKPPDSRTIPMCAAHHHEQHSIGEVTFHGDKLHHAIDLAAALFQVSGNFTNGLKAIFRFRRT